MAAPALRAAISPSISSSFSPADLPQPEANGEKALSPLPSWGRGFQLRVPVAEHHVGPPRLDAMLPGVAHQLGGLVEAHRLAVEQGGAEDVRVVTFDPGRDVDQLGEAHRVALGEAVGAEALDLLEAALGEVRVVAAPDHAIDELQPVVAHRAQVAEGGHRAAQAVGLSPG